MLAAAAALVITHRAGVAFLVLFAAFTALIALLMARIGPIYPGTCQPPDAQRPAISRLIIGPHPSHEGCESFALIFLTGTLALATEGGPHPLAHRFRALIRCRLRAVGDWDMDCSRRPVRCSRCGFLPGPVDGGGLWMRSAADLRLALGAVGDPGAGGLCGIGEVPLADVFASRPVCA
jgi:hypothetical protein